MSWRNAGNEIIIEALCPKDLQPKDLKCSFNSHTLLLEVAGKPIATGKLSAAIKPDECTWEFGPLLTHRLSSSVLLETASALLRLGYTDVVSTQRQAAVTPLKSHLEWDTDWRAVRSSALKML